MSELYTYQKADAARIFANEGILLASDTGTGKTATLIRAAEHEALRVWTEEQSRAILIVVCPAVVRGVWAQEWKKWAKLPWNVTRINKGDDLSKLRHLDPTTNNVVIISYDQFSREEGPKKAKVCPAREALINLNFSHFTMIADEAHYLKGWGSNRTTHFYETAKALKAKVWLASATPAPNHFGEVYPMIQNLWPYELVSRGITSKEAFEDMFCHVKSLWMNGREIRTISGSKNGPALKSLLSAYMIRRKKVDVLEDLPPMTIDTLPLEIPVPNFGSGYMDREFSALQDDELLAAVNAASTAIATIRKETGIAKVQKCVEWVHEFLTDPEAKLVVFAYHTEVIDALQNLLKDFYPVVIDGRTPSKTRDDAVHAFQNAGSRVFIGQIVAAGTGITLTRASTVLFVESDWTPSNNYQAASRCHRIGQKDHVMVYHAVLEGSLDERIAKALVRKEREIAEIFG
jgi:SWI/SNF-related matrix-associated actin-dependent regulator 1 of chromatin subfamily A